MNNESTLTGVAASLQPLSRMETYLAYLETDHWRFLRNQAIALAGMKCESCGSRKTLQGHHIRYRDLYDCTPEDIMSLCDVCHKDWHSCFSSHVEKDRQFVLGFLHGRRALVNPVASKAEPKPKKPKKETREARLVGRDLRRHMVKTDPAIIAAFHLPEDQFKAFARKHFEGRSRKGAICKYAFDAYKRNRK